MAGTSEGSDDPQPLLEGGKDSVCLGEQVLREHQAQERRAGHDLFVQLFDLSCNAERAVVHVAARATGDLSDLFRLQSAHSDAVELLQRGERDVVDIHVDAHADGIRRDEEIHIS